MLTATGARLVVDALPRYAALATFTGTEVQGPGYRRQNLGPWTSDDGHLFSAPTVTFGPARHGAWSEARQVVLVDGDGWDPVEVAEIEPFTALDGSTLKVLPLLTVPR